MEKNDFRIKCETINRLKSGLFKRDLQFEISPMINIGIVMQRIDRVSSEELSPPLLAKLKIPSACFNHSYYEYWKLSELGNDNKNVIHDTWTYWQKDLIQAELEDCLAKYKSKNKIKMTGIIFWVEESHTRYKEIIETFCSKGKFAGNLPSKSTIAYEEELNQIFQHEFSHEWDLTNDKLFYEAIKEIFAKHGNTMCNFYAYIDLFCKNPIYQKLKQLSEKYGCEWFS